MAFANGKESVEGIEFKKYIGIGTVKILTVNPTKAELEKIYKTTLDKEPEYLSEKDGVKSIRLDFILQTVPEKNNGIEYTGKYSLFVKNAPRKNTDGTKIQVIDAYGETAWVTKEELEGKLIPEKSARLSSNYRPCFTGEEAVVKLLKAHLCIPDSTTYNKETGTWTKISNIKEAEASLENVKEYFSGNIKELKNAIQSMPNNLLKVVFGIKTTDENKQYQAFFTDSPMKLATTKYDFINKRIKESQDAGGYANTEFSIKPLQEYVVSSTPISDTTSVFETSSTDLDGWGDNWEEAPKL